MLHELGLSFPLLEKKKLISQHKSSAVLSNAWGLKSTFVFGELELLHAGV